MMDGTKSEIPKVSTLDSTRFNVRYIERERKRLSIVQFPFYSALGCLVPFLTAHMNDIGLTAKQSALINTLTGLISVLGPLIFGPIAYRYHKYNLIICVTLFLSTISYTSLLFVPRVLRTAKHSSIIFDCTNGELLIERCQNWENNCSLHPKRLAYGNFTDFTLYSCNYACDINNSFLHGNNSFSSSSSSSKIDSNYYQSSPSSSSNVIDPIQVCFESSSEGTLCLESSDSPKPSTSVNPVTGKYLDPIQFDSRFDRWPESEPRGLLIGNSHLVSCSFQPNEALIIKSQNYQSISCRPAKPGCFIHCRVDMVHRSHSILTSPLPCYRLSGRPQVTFYSYLALRSVADLTLFTGFSLLDSLAITLTNDFDSIYGRASKLFAITLPMSLWSIGAGILSDYFSLVTKRPDYSPIFVIYDGFILITIILIICFPVEPISITSNLISYTSLSSTSLNGESNRRQQQNQNSPNHQSTLTKISSTRSTTKKQTESSSMKFRHKIGLFLLLPFTLILGTTWGLLYNYLPAYYLELGIDKTWLSVAYSLGFIGYAPFCLIIKSLTSGIGRIHLIVLAFTFYSIRLVGISFLHQPRWTIIPFQLMETFTLPLAWVGITSSIHRLLPSFATGSHLIVQYTLVIIHFGLGRSLGGLSWWLWLQDWEFNHNRWNWLIYDWPLIQIAANYDISSYRLLLRLTAIILAICGFVLLFFYHLYCFCCSPIKKRSSSSSSSHRLKKQKTNNRLKGKQKSQPSTSTSNQLQQSTETDVLLNGIHGRSGEDIGSPSSPFNSPSGDNNQSMINDQSKLITSPKTMTTINEMPSNGETNGIKLISKVGEDDL
ncbi:uncharacterized protein LOC128388338 [Panonychus citri]|uniref:uncharacterized protein LOC128388338 n=1 Tax=Panonychus citri TaxID=50023 RepID=UPI0023083226|nr:uncharacterized protein LOC128388338 [Panonychus citri]